MEPQLEGCGKPAQRGWLTWAATASMEPQLEGCGKHSTCVSRSRRKQLQWSRNLRVAESLYGLFMPTTAFIQLQWSRNLRVAESARERRITALAF